MTDSDVRTSSTRYARCNCGSLTLSLPEEPSKIVVACHCIDCQRRTGAPFGVGAYYPAKVVAISGASKEFTHAAANTTTISRAQPRIAQRMILGRISQLAANTPTAAARSAPRKGLPTTEMFWGSIQYSTIENTDDPIHGRPTERHLCVNALYS